ncbi:MAG: histidine--tRNA ligase, partial [Acetobacteraceae bacterium]
ATAGICRALVSNGLTQSLPQKVFCAGPMFRYERPQKGRYRQFHQIDIELIGPAEPLADAEVIACGWDILVALGVATDTVLEVNTLGDMESRAAYRAALVGYFQAHKDSLSEDSLERLERNPMRIVDSKDERDRRIVAEAPTIGPYLTQPAADFYAQLKRHLDSFRVPYRENPRIVRGLDYYGHTAFEFVTDRLGAQGTVMGGGRYDGLVEEMGGPPTRAVGWAAGIERLAMLLGDLPPLPAPVAVVPIGDAAEATAISVLQSLRGAGIRAEMSYRGNLRRRLERANRIGARAAVLIGDDDIAAGVAQIKDLATGAQSAVPLAEVVRACSV